MALLTVRATAGMAVRTVSANGRARKSFGLLGEREAIERALQIDFDTVSAVHLVGGNQPQSGWTSRRSIARFKWRAPYFTSVPSLKSKAFAGPVNSNISGCSGEECRTRWRTIFNSMSRICSS
jgi:hypothetical protein